MSKERCPYCGSGELDAEYVHNGLGYEQVTPKSCYGCGAVEIRHGYNKHLATGEELKNGYLKGFAELNEEEIRQIREEIWGNEK